MKSIMQTIEELRAIKCMVTSLSIHGAAIASLVLAPQFLPIQSGTVPSESIQIDVVAPLGEQAKTMDVGPQLKSPSVSLPQPKVEPQAKIESAPKPKEEVIVQQPKPAPKPAKPTPKVAAVTPVATPTVKKAELKKQETTLPAVETLEEELIPESAPVVDVTDPNSEIPALTEVTKNVEVKKEETPVAKIESFEPQQPTTAEVAKEAQPTEKAAAAPSAAPIAQQPTQQLLAQAVPNGPQAMGVKAIQPQSDLNYGVPAGTRDFSQLRPAPGNVPPQYPELARMRGIQGDSLLIYYVSEQGRISQMRLLRSSGSSILDEEAQRAVGQYKFFPGQQGWTYQKVSFNLRGQAKETTTRLRTFPNAN